MDQRKSKTRYRWMMVAAVVGMILLAGLDLFRLLRYYIHAALPVEKEMRSFLLAEIAICVLTCACVLIRRTRTAMVGPVWLGAYLIGMYPILESRIYKGHDDVPRIVAFVLLGILIVINIPGLKVLRWRTQKIVSRILWFLSFGIFLVMTVVTLNGSSRVNRPLVLLGAGFVLAILTWHLVTLPGLEAICGFGGATALTSASVFLLAPLLSQGLSEVLADQDVFVAAFLPFALRAAVVVLLAFWMIWKAHRSRGLSTERVLPRFNIMYDGVYVVEDDEIVVVDDGDDKDGE